MELSIIIVSYNVKYFLEQCLCSVKKAVESLESGVGSREWGEIIIMDNNSSDGSVEYLQEKFPFVHFICNKENTGFAKANNQALQMANGKYVLFLNPDTIVPENCFSKCLSFMESHPDAGALGIHMSDGSGRFLRESKRGFPSPWTAFCKLIGLSKLFPESKIFNGYYLGHLSENQNQEVAILSGAFFLCRKEALDKTGGFDERFFMYAEDIDLSYRLQKAGYTNYYFAESSIIHFKGESTRKDPRHVKLFYKAMSQFARKHFRGPLSGLLHALTEIVIWFRAGIAALLSIVSSKKTAKKIRSIIVTKGDEWLQWKNKLAPQREIVADLFHADEIIYCESDQFLFKDIIHHWQVHSRAKLKMIHASGSDSIVGSNSKDRQGVVIVLNE